MASYMKFHQLCRNMLVMMSLIEAFTTHCTKKTRVYTTLNVLTGSESGRPVGSPSIRMFDLTSKFTSEIAYLLIPCL
jgi:hypothetical protein